MVQIMIFYLIRLLEAVLNSQLSVPVKYVDLQISSSQLMDNAMICPTIENVRVLPDGWVCLFEKIVSIMMPIQLFIHRPIMKHAQQHQIYTPVLLALTQDPIISF
jgi:hypothetical protein